MATRFKLSTPSTWISTPEVCEICLERVIIKKHPVYLTYEGQHTSTVIVADAYMCNNCHSTTYNDWYSHTPRIKLTFIIKSI